MQGQMKNSFDLSKSVTYPLRGVAMIMIIMHHTYLSFLSLGYGSMPLWLDSSGIDYAWGYCGTGIFFFMSGYGMFFSLTKHRIDCSYIKEKCLKLLSPYIALWLISLIAFVIFSRQSLSTDLLRHFFMLDIPPDVDAWFFKVIVALYIFSMLMFRLVKNPKWCVAIIGICTILWYLFACFGLRLGPWWFVSVLNFPLGMVVAINKNKMQNVSPLLIAMGGVV